MAGIRFCFHMCPIPERLKSGLLHDGSSVFAIDYSIIDIYVNKKYTLHVCIVLLLGANPSSRRGMKKQTDRLAVLSGFARKATCAALRNDSN